MDYKNPIVIELRKTDHRFNRLCKKHEHIEKEINGLIKGVGNSADEELKIAELKKEKLIIKEELSQMMKA